MILSPVIGSGSTNSKIRASGTTTERSLADRFAEVFNILDFGARPNDPAFDNRASIQAALDAAFQKGGGVVEIPDGTFWLTGTGNAVEGGLRIRSNTTLRGAGIGLSTLKLVNGYNASLTGVLRTPSGEQHKKIQIMDVTLDANGGGQTAGTQMAFFCGTAPDAPVENRCEDIRLLRVEATGGKGSSGYGFDPHENVLRISFIDCQAHDNELDGFVIDGCREAVITGCQSWSNGRHGFNFVTRSENNVISGCHAVQNGGNGIAFQNGATRTAVSTCVIRGNGQEGINIRGDATYGYNTHVAVTGCLISQNLRRGIRCEAASYNYFAMNRLIDNAQAANNTYDDLLLIDNGTVGSTFNEVLLNTIHSTATNRSRYNIREEPSLSDNNMFVANRSSGCVNGTPQSFNGANSFVLGVRDQDFFIGRSSSSRFFLENSGRLRWGSANTATTAGAAGSAAAPPASPQLYLEVEDSAQNRLLVPAYLKAS
jgi:hypothetical protein